MAMAGKTFARKMTYDVLLVVNHEVRIGVLAPQTAEEPAERPLLRRRGAQRHR